MFFVLIYSIIYIVAGQIRQEKGTNQSEKRDYKMGKRARSLNFLVLGKIFSEQNIQFEVRVHY